MTLLLVVKNNWVPSNQRRYIPYGYVVPVHNSLLLNCIVGTSGTFPICCDKVQRSQDLHFTVSKFDRSEFAVIICSFRYHYNLRDPKNSEPLGDGLLTLKNLGLTSSPTIKTVKLISPADGKHKGTVCVYLSSAVWCLIIPCRWRWWYPSWVPQRPAMCRNTQCTSFNVGNLSFCGDTLLLRVISFPLILEGENFCLDSLTQWVIRFSL